jgi:DNA-binding transcriptional LysR family regulator
VLPALRDLRATHPQIRVDLTTGSARLDIARREADLALRYIRPESGALISRRVARIAFTAYASREYLASRPRPERGKGFAGHDVAAFDSSIRAWSHGELAGEPLRDARTVLRTNNSFVLLEAVAVGIGIADLPCIIADPDPRVRRVFPDAALRLEDAHLVVHPDVQRTARVRAVIEALEARLREATPLLLGERPQRR